MKKNKNSTEYLILVLGLALFILSFFFYDGKINYFFSTEKNPAISLFLSFITNFGIVLVIFVLIPLTMLFNKKKKSEAYLILKSALVSFIICTIIKFIFQRHRPMDSNYYSLSMAINYSFPSMHTMVVFAALPLLVKNFPRQRHVWIALAFIVAFSRIYFGVHYASDVLFGAVAGYSIGLLFARD